MRRILVINPNSNESVTEGLRHTLARYVGVASIQCCTISEGPFGIESDANYAAVQPLIIEKINVSPGYDSYVIACYSDPALASCRRLFGQHVFGVQRSAVEKAATLGGKFGVLALSQSSIARHVEYISSLGYNDRLAAEIPLNITVDQSANNPTTIEKAIAGGLRLVNEFGASSVILGCAGMAHAREAVEKEVGVPVIEPVSAAVDQALD